MPPTTSAIESRIFRGDSIRWDGDGIYHQNVNYAPTRGTWTRVFDLELLERLMAAGYVPEYISFEDTLPEEEG